MTGVEKFGLDDTFGPFSDRWRPRVVAALNGQEVKLVKIEGQFPWHDHEFEDEMFLLRRGKIRVEFRDRVVALNEGEALVVARGVEHRTVAEREAQVVLFEPADVRNTGNVVDDRYTAPRGAGV